MFRNNNASLAVALCAVLAGVAPCAFAAGADQAKSVAEKQQAAALPAYLKGSGELTPAQRGQVARDFVNRWGAYFQSTYKQPVGRWALKQAQVIAKADSNNLRLAMSKQTLEAAMMAMRGHDVSDVQALGKMAAKVEAGLVGPMALGDLAEDLVFTPLPPCRIFDTRNTGGVLPNGGTRSFDTYPYGTNTNFSYQGGTSSGNCGMPADAAAVVLNIAAPLSISGGFLTVYPYGTTRPLASNLDYSAGELKNNEIIAKSANSTWDITVYAHGSTHVVGDVVGYYIRPEATAVECVHQTVTAASIANGVRSFETVSCPAGYKVTGGGVATGTNQGSYMNASGPAAGGATTSNSWFSSVTNGTGSAQTYTHYATCCRVPGR